MCNLIKEREQLVELILISKPIHIKFQIDYNTSNFEYEIEKNKGSNNIIEVIESVDNICDNYEVEINYIRTTFEDIFKELFYLLKICGQYYNFKNNLEKLNLR